eukprot:10377468-Heterocapsa_arctica.AAC.1
MVALRVPIKWAKVAGGQEVQGSGFAINWKGRLLGLTRRARTGWWAGSRSTSPSQSWSATSARPPMGWATPSQWLPTIG